MVILGLVLLVLGLILGVGWLVIVGAVLAVVGLVVNLGYARPRGGHYWY